LRLIKQFKIETQRVHHDTTTVTFQGRYDASVSEPQITHGHNKDHRPDLKQFIFGLSVSSDGAVPLTHQVLSGNRADDTVHRPNLEELRALLGQKDFIYVADSKLGTSANLRDIASHHGKFVTVLARTRKEDKEFRKALRQKGVRWKTIYAHPHQRSASDPPDRYASCSGSPKTAEGYRLVWIRSSAKATLDTAFRKHQLEKARAELSLLNTRLNRRQLRAARSIRTAARALLKQTGMEQFVQVSLVPRIQEQVKRCKPGRPSPTDPVRLVKKTIWSLKVEIDRKALRQEKRVDGVFPLVTNMEKTPKKEVLLIYKYQPYVEKRFSQFKTDLEVAPVYLKKPLRCAGLVHAYFVALTVASLIERAVRKNMQQEGIQELPLFPEGRMTATPTCPRILEAFRGVSWHQFKRGDETICFPIKLSPLQKTLLRLLEVPIELYK
jgi:transposase